MVFGICRLATAAAALSISWLLSWPINLIWLGRTAGLPVRRFLLNGVRILGTGAIAAAVVMLIPFEGIIGAAPLLVLVEALLTAVLCVGLVAILPDGRQDLSTAARASRTLLRRR